MEHNVLIVIQFLILETLFMQWFYLGQCFSDGSETGTLFCFFILSSAVVPYTQHSSPPPEKYITIIVHHCMDVLLLF